MDIKGDKGEFCGESTAGDYSNGGVFDETVISCAFVIAGGVVRTGVDVKVVLFHVF